MNAFIILLLAADGGASLSGIPPWGTSISDAKLHWTGLRPIATPEGEANNWLYQSTSERHFGVEVVRIELFFGQTGLSNAALEFPDSLDGKSANHAAAVSAIENLFGKPDESGDCWQRWKRDSAVVVLEFGRILLFSPWSRSTPGADYSCQRVRIAERCAMVPTDAGKSNKLQLAGLCGNLKADAGTLAKP